MYTEFYQVLLLFVFYSFVGWGTEIAYHTLTTGHYVNRGFLSGPVCPIYGVGVLTVLLILAPFKDQWFIVFIGGAILTSFVELTIGFLMEKKYETRWWDYSEEPYNFKGYICLKFSIIWGFACVIVVANIEPIIEKLIYITPPLVELIILVIIYVVLFIDTIDSVSRVNKFTRELKTIKNIANRLKESSTEIGENIAESVIDLEAKRKTIKLRVKGIEERKEVVIDKIANKIFDDLENNKRILYAFPKFRDESINKTIDEFQESYQEEIRARIDALRLATQKRKKYAKKKN